MSDTVEVLNAIGPVLAASAGVIGGLVALVRGAPRIKRLFGTTDQTQIIVRLREQLEETQELAELRAAMITELKFQITTKDADLVAAQGDLDYARRTADDLRRRLAAANRGDVIP